MARITKTIFLTAAEAAVYKSTGTCQHVTPDGDTITVSDADTDCIVHCPEDEPITRAELAEAVKHHYSTTEQVVGTFIDGKPVYEKTFVVEQSTAHISYDINVTNLNVEHMISVGGPCQLGGEADYQWVVAPMYENGSYHLFIKYTSGNKTITIVAAGWGVTNAYVTARYTKTTDTAPSA